MVTLAFELPAGRYHATPWGRHVNEGAIEWPPSPWRIFRALLATGYAKLGWSEVPEVGRSLMGKLAERLPAYAIPRQVGSGHTRHYMPDYAGKRARVLDAWAFVGRATDPVLGVAWDVALCAEEMALLEALVSRVGYLGRAESWAVGAVVEAWPPAKGLVECVPGEVAPGQGYERVTLLAPMPGRMLADWSATMDAAWAAEITETGRGKRGKKRGGAALPRTVVEALLVTTPALQSGGWSQPPGSRWVTYWRPTDAVVARPEVTRRRRSAMREHADTALFAVSSDTRQADRYPRMQDALWRCDALHAALVRRSSEADRGVGVPSVSLRGCDAAGRRLDGHRHAHVFGVELNTGRGARVGGDGWIDHFLVHAPMGFEPAAQEALRRVRKTWAKDLPDLFLTLVGLGMKSDFQDVAASVLGRARTWETVTPFVPPRHLKRRGKDTLEGQVRVDLASRGFPEPVAIEVQLEGADALAWRPASWFEAVWARHMGWQADTPNEAAAELRLASHWRHHRRERRDEDKRPPQRVAVGLRVTFSEEAEGPVALGYGSHLGLGLMAAASVRTHHHQAEERGDDR